VPSHAAVVRYDGKRGTVWRVKFVDADGKQVMETLGKASDGWTRRKAEAELRARLVAVEREGFRKPERMTFAVLAREWLDTAPDARNLKRSTRSGYRTIIERHLIPALGTLQLEEVTVERIERYLADKRKAGLKPATLHRQLVNLSEVMKVAVRRGLVRSNPVHLVERPKASRRRWRILSPTEVQAVERGFDALIAEAEDDEEGVWRLTCRIVFLVTYGAGLRRGEILGLRWRAVHLADPDGAWLRVEETFVRGAADTPKSEKGERSIALGPRLADELFEHRARTAYAGDDERVFASRKGTPIDPRRYAKTLRLALAKAKVDGYVRPFHDGRHSSITNAAAAGTSPAALMARAGHSDFATTQLYIDLAGERFRDEAELLERRLWGESGRSSRYKPDAPADADEPAKETQALG
jgi:integrase